MLYTDGFVHGPNPSKIGGGYTITDQTGRVLIRREMTPAEIQRDTWTNNDGEVRGIIHAIWIAKEGDVIITDSRVAYAWILNAKCKARPDLAALCRLARDKMRSKRVTIKWEGRETNLAGIHNENEQKKAKPSLF